VPIRVRPVVESDFVAVTALLQELGRPVILGTPEEEGGRRVFGEWLADPTRLAFVAEDDDGVIGFIDVVVMPRLNFAEPEVHVPDLIVAERARSRGAGAALLATAEELARERGAFALTLDSANWRTRAHVFYVREGMEPDAKHFAKVLRDRGWPPPPPTEDDATG
jgi:GNAT superfamily N-acetyltransferase